MNSLESDKDDSGLDFMGWSFLRELLLTLAAAIWTGLTGSMLLILLVFLLTGPGG